MKDQKVKQNADLFSQMLILPRALYMNNFRTDLMNALTDKASCFGKNKTTGPYVTIRFGSFSR